MSETYYLHVTTLGKEERIQVPPPMLPCLRVEILAQGDGEIVERTYTYDHRPACDATERR